MNLHTEQRCCDRNGSLDDAGSKGKDPRATNEGQRGVTVVRLGDALRLIHSVVFITLVLRAAASWSDYRFQTGPEAFLDPKKPWGKYRSKKKPGFRRKGYD